MYDCTTEVRHSYLFLCLHVYEYNDKMLLPMPTYVSKTVSVRPQLLKL